MMPDYYMLNETLVDEETTMKHREILHEDAVEIGGRRLYTVTFKQVLQSFGVRNWNGRIYDKDTVMKAIDTNPLIQHDLKMQTWLGEYGHPIIEKGMNELARQMTMFPPNCCWNIKKYWLEGNLLMGEVTTLAGGYGDMLRDRILTGLPAMASSRAIGGVDKNGHVLPGYVLVCFDSVVRCSHKEAYMVPDSQKINDFIIPTGQMNTMSESAIMLSPDNSELKQFLLTESASSEKIRKVCDALDIDADTIVITENSVKVTRMNEDGKQTIIMPLQKLVGASYYHLFE